MYSFHHPGQASVASAEPGPILPRQQPVAIWNRSRIGHAVRDDDVALEQGRRKVFPPGVKALDERDFPVTPPALDAFFVDDRGSVSYTHLTLPTKA